MTAQQIQIATEKEADQCIAVMSLGFSNDPGVRWMFPDPQQYIENFPPFVKAFGGRAFKNNSAYYVGNFFATALWLPPDVQPDEEQLMTLIENSVPSSDRSAVFKLFEQMDSYHPKEPHWHLPLIATDPSWQSMGYGSALLNYVLDICDKQKTPAYLEATSERNVPLYQRNGFEVLGSIQAGTSPYITPMLREPKS